MNSRTTTVVRSPSDSRRGFILRLAAVAGGIACGGWPRLGHAAEYSVPQVQAVFLFNFAQFVKWPPKVFADAGTPITIGVLGSNPFNGALDKAVKGENIGGRRLTVKYARQPEDLKNCHIVFISNSESGRVAALLDSYRGTSVLTVSDIPRFCEQGGMINFVLESGRVKFAINPRPAKSAGLQISSKLLRLAY